jgi:hypothetical protein
MRISSQIRIKTLGALATIVAAGTMTMTMTLTLAGSAQVPLTSYADSQGYVDVQKLTCAQLGGTYQDDADLLAA